MEIVWRYLSFTKENSQKGSCIKLKDFGKGTSARKERRTTYTEQIEKLAKF